MNKNTAIAWTGSLLILALGIAFSADNPQKAARNTYRNTVKSGFDKGLLFVDENGDGICDLASNGRKNGTPNLQPPEWSKQKENKGYRNRNKNNAISDQFQKRFNHREENTWNTQSPRQNRENFGKGICDSTGPKGRSSRKGNGQ